MYKYKYKYSSLAQRTELQPNIYAPRSSIPTP